jgi:hypothetical protein
MNTTSESYRPFFNRRVDPDIRQLIADRDQLVHQANEVPMHHFAKPALPPVVNVTPFRRRHFGDTCGNFPRVA